jgi:8-oxo-dGTP diphosphatase
VANPARTVLARVRPLAYKTFGILPPRLRRGIVGVLAPSFTVGALAVLHDGDKILFVRQLHRPGLALPGGLLKRGEPARDGLARELSEELDIDPTGLAPAPDTAHVDPSKTRVDLIWLLALDRQQVQLSPGNEVLSYEWRDRADAELTPQTREILQGIASRLP